jgi:hypothetical protein
MLAGVGNIGFKVENFNRANMEVLEAHWPDVKRSLRVAVQLLGSFGFSERTLRADSALLPIAYYLCHRRLDSTHITKGSFGPDRDALRTWLVRSLLKASGIWGSGLDTLLTALREAIARHGNDEFPTAELHEVMARRGKSLAFSDEEITELVEMRYGDKRLFALLTLLFPFVDTRNHVHIDHFYPRSLFTKQKLKTAGVSDDDVVRFQEMVDDLPNLQLLEGSENTEKLASLPACCLAYEDISDRGGTDQPLQQPPTGRRVRVVDRVRGILRRPV